MGRDRESTEYVTLTLRSHTLNYRHSLLIPPRGLWTTRHALITKDLGQRRNVIPYMTCHVRASACAAESRPPLKAKRSNLYESPWGGFRPPLRLFREMFASITRDTAKIAINVPYTAVTSLGSTVYRNAKVVSTNSIYSQYTLSSAVKTRTGNKR